jgi:hypothetical protein
MAWQIWQESECLTAVQWGERLHVEDVNGRLHIEGPEPVYLVTGLAPETEQERQALVGRLQNGVARVYQSLEGIQRAWWQ